ncbi:MAG: transposase [Acidobacteriales bacterium]|nr:transposase [Terriglobales bacterium]
MNNERPTFFVTTVCHERAAVFRNERLARLMIEILHSYRDQGKYVLHEFVRMHDHAHLILTPADWVSLEKLMQFVKGGFSFQAKKRFFSQREIWQKGFTHETIKTSAAYAGFRGYLLRNPVKAGLCASREEFSFSSANTGFVMDPPPMYLRG